MKRLKHYILLLLVAGLVSSCGLDLAGEPEIVATIPPRPTLSPDADRMSMPTVPDLTRGAEIFVQNCTRCHGETGDGNGELVMTGQISADMMPNFTEPSASTPLERFDIITNGRIDNLMPPWSGSLDSYDRWAVTYYTLSLPYTSEQSARGEAFATDITFEDAADKNDLDLLIAFSESLDNEEDRLAAVAYVRTQGFSAGEFTEVAEADAPAEVIAPVEADTVAEPVTLTTLQITGTVTQGTQDSPLPDNLMVTLHIVDSVGESETIEREVNTDGSFVFESIPAQTDKGYVVSAYHADRFFTSRMVSGTDLSETLAMPLTIFDITDDPAALVINSITYQVQPDEDGLLVLQIMSLQNISDKLFTRAELLEDGIRYPSVQLKLPPQAEYRALSQADARYAVEGQTIYDTRPVAPGREHLIHVAYHLPYTNKAPLVQSLDYPIAGFVEVYVPEGIQINGSQFESVQLEQQRFYAGEFNLGADSTIQFEINGRVRQASGSGGLSRTTLSMLLGGAGVIFMIAAAVVFFMGRHDDESSLVAQIAELDQRFEAGELEQQDYEKKRVALKARLMSQMAKE